jgi:hypothetical protein
MKKRVSSIIIQLLQSSWALSSETWFFKIYIGEAHMGYTQGSCRHFEVELIHLGFVSNQIKSQNRSAFMNGSIFDNQLEVIYMTLVKL